MGNRQRESYTPDGCDRQNGDVQCAKRVGQHTAASVDCPDAVSAIEQGAKGATLKLTPDVPTNVTHQHMHRRDVDQTTKAIA